MNPPPIPSSAEPIQYAAFDSQRVTDDSHLKLLSIFYFVVGGLIALFSCMFLIHIAIGIAAASGALPMNQNTTQPVPQNLDRWFGWFFIAIGSIALLLGWGTAICNILVGRALRQRKWRLFILIMAGLNCASVPFGTVLGVFTFIVMLRPSVEMEFKATRPLSATTATPTPAH